MKMIEYVAIIKGRSVFMDSNMKKLCSKCGSELDVRHAFCGVCGQKVVMDGEGTSYCYP